MSRALLAALAALILAAPAGAHSRLDVRYGQAAALEGMIAGWRVDRGLFATVPTLQTMTGVIAIQRANWEEARHTSKIDGEPFGVWSYAIFVNDPRAIMLTRRCHIGKDGSWKPAKAFRAWKRKPSSRRVLRSPLWHYMSVRSAVMHKHKGDLKGQGFCQTYYVIFSAPLLRKR